jgi:photosystem II stability/assembly factor-like uncharacterized protein
MRRFHKIFVFVSVLICFQIVNANWVKQKSGTLAWLRTGFFVNEKQGWIGGSNGTLLTTGDGGDSWRQTEKFTSDTIRQIYFSDEKNGWLLCERDIYSLGANSPSYLLKTSNGGADWQKIEFLNNSRIRIAKIFFSENGLGFAVGESGAIFILQDDAKTWKKQPSPIRYLLLDGIFTNKRNGVMVGAGGNIFFTDDAGISWNKANIFGTPDVKFNAVFFVNKDTGWTAGADGKIFQSVSGGKNWREQKSGTTANLNDIFFKDTREGWAIGDEGTILYTTTAGNVWKKNELKIRHKLEKIFFSDKDGWAVGFGGTILRYDLSNRNKSSKPGAPLLIKNVR